MENFWEIQKNGFVVRRKLIGDQKRKQGLRPLWPSNSLGGQVWPQIWSLWTKIHILRLFCVSKYPDSSFTAFHIFWTSIKKKEKRKLGLLESSASPQLKTFSSLSENYQSLCDKKTMLCCKNLCHLSSFIIQSPTLFHTTWFTHRIFSLSRINVVEPLRPSSFTSEQRHDDLQGKRNMLSCR